METIKKIAVITGNRAEYGLLRNVIAGINQSEELQLQLIVTGSHLSDLYGRTIDEIRQDGFEIAEEIDMLLQSSKKSGMVKAMGIELMQLGGALERLGPDLLLILGDRYEMLIAAVAATSMNIPIGHIAGGEVSYGAIDEQIRHAITKMAHLHFTEAEVYAENVKHMGEEAWRVFNVGALGIENIKRIALLEGEELTESVGMQVTQETMLLTYHPVTLESDTLKWQIDELLGALDTFKSPIMITYPNPDNGGAYIIERLNEYAKRRSNIKVFSSLGVKRYLSVMCKCGLVIGNSSSALIEAPYLKVPVVNIGNRQEGRLMANNIISCSNKKEDIIKSIQLAKSKKFRETLIETKSLYGEGNTSEAIVKILEAIDIDEKLLRKKLVWR
ncbi:MAG: UDP-N-acetylglucosamine 2-epimerase [Cellulosilyticaceae bacterium]